MPSAPAPAKKSKGGARAIGVVEFLPGGGVRLVPIALRFEGKYYDASLYEANPEPLAVEPGTVYEVQNYGEPAGLFVVNTPKLSNAGWIGDGSWTARRAMDEQLAAQAARQPKAQAKQSKAIFTGGADEGPPVLRRPEEQGSASAKEQPASNLRQQRSHRQLLPQRQMTATLTARFFASLMSSPVPTRKLQPNRCAPLLPTRTILIAQCSRVANQPPTSPQSLSPKVPVSGLENSKTSPGKLRSLAAVSDAGKYETRSLLYTTAPEQQPQLAQAMLALALADMRTFADKHTPGPKVPRNSAIKDYDLRSFDLDFSNSPTLVLTAKLPIPTAGSKPFLYYATIVAHLDINGEPVKIFSSVTDTTHLDVFPHLELIDALDADANGRGDLLFRQYSDTGMNYGLYRVFPYQMEKIFEGGSSL